MKKTLAIISAAIMLLCGILTITGCNIKDNSNNNNSKAEVVLDKVSAAAYIEKSIQPQAISIFNLSENSADSSNSESKEDTPDISVDIPTDYTFIFKSQLEINFDIKLNNPKNYYIMDFKLTCNEEQIEYYDKEMEKWTPINNIWIRWSGSNNQESRYRLRLPNPEISPDKIKISEMYYSDRTDGTNKTAVNMNNKETYTVYKVEDDLVVTETVSNSREKYIFKMAKKEGVEIKSFTVAGVDYMDRINDEGLYEMTSNGKIVVEYEKKNGNVTYKGKYEKDIELFSYEKIIGVNHKDGFINIKGTDLPMVLVKSSTKSRPDEIYYDILNDGGMYFTGGYFNIYLIFADDVILDDDGQIIGVVGEKIIDTINV